MRIHRTCLATAFIAASVISAHAQNAENVVKLPNDIGFKAPLRPGGPAAAVVYGDSKLKAYPAGTFYSEPPKSPHFNWAKDGEVILQITGIGPAGATNIPQKQ